MTKHTRLVRRGATYYFRVKIPVDLIGHYGTKREIIESLRTKDEREARRLVAARSELQEHEFERIRQGRKVTELTAEQVQALADELYAGMLYWDEHAREQGLSEEDHEAINAEVASWDSYIPAALARNDVKRGGFLAHLTLQRHGITLPKDSPSYRRLTYALLKASVRANDAVRARQEGKVVDTPAVTLVGSPVAVTVAAVGAQLGKPVGAPVAAPAGGVGLADVLTKWAAERKPRSKTTAEWSGIVRDFTRLTGTLPVSAITKAHVLAYKDHMVRTKRAPATVRKKLAVLHGLLQYALENDLCERNAATGVRVHAPRSMARQHIPVEDLQRLFTSPVFTKGERPQGGAGEAAYWLPLLALFSGARLEELGQLHLKDVKRSDGVDYLELTEGEDQKLKNQGSRRSVPIHPELLRLGFLDYVEGRRAAGDVRLFPLLRRDGYGKWTKLWGEWWTRYRRSVGVGARWHDLHALRHTFERGCRECGIPEDIRDALTGHSGGGVGRTYGGRYPLATLAKAIKELRYAGLDLRSRWVQP